MAATRRLVQDEEGMRWLVCKGDPAWLKVSLLAKNRTLIILPREVITRDALVSPVGTADLVQRLKNVFLLTNDEALRDALKRATVMYDCLQVCYNESRGGTS
jgi:hypothetical protein